MILKSVGIGEHPKKHVYSDIARNTSTIGRNAPLESVRKQIEIWPWKTACESLKQQQDSCPKHAKRKPEKLSKRCLRNPLKRKKKCLQQGKPWRQVRSSGIATKATRNLALDNRIRKPQTAAGFVPKARETQARKTLETLPTEPTKKKEKNASSKENLGARYAPLESLRKQLEIWPWKTASESLKQQQDSCPKHAKRKPEKLSKRCLRNPLKRKKKMPPARKTLAPRKTWKPASHHANPNKKLLGEHPKKHVYSDIARNTSTIGRNAPLESVRKQLEIWPWKAASENLKQQQDSCPKHVKRKPEKLSKRCLRNPL